MKQLSFSLLFLSLFLSSCTQFTSVRQDGKTKTSIPWNVPQSSDGNILLNKLQK